MTHPSLERRPASVQIAKEVLEKPQTINKYSLPLRQGKTVNTFSLFKKAIAYSTFTGAISVGACAAIYSTFLLGILGTILGGIVGIFLGLLLGLENGIIFGIVTRFGFFPLTNPKLHRQVLTGISIVLCTSISIVFLLDKMGESNFLVVLLSISVGLSMGANSKSIARWYQQESEL
jgi:hypothetical protein